MSIPFKRYIFVGQHDETDCGAACLAAVFKWYGLKVPVTRIREAAGTDKQGSTGLGLVKAAQKYGFTAKGYKQNKEDFPADIILPAIANVIIDQKRVHFVVVYSADSRNIVIADPGEGIVKYTREDFFKIWTGMLIELSPGESFEKGDETHSVINMFYELIKPQKLLFVCIFLTSVLLIAIGIATSFYFKYLLDDVFGSGVVGMLNTVSIAIIVISVLRVLVNALRTQLLLHLSRRLDINLILGYYRHVLKLPMSFFSMRKSGEIISRFMDAGKVRDSISSAVLTIMIDSVMALAGGIILYMQNRTLFLITLVIILIYGVTVTFFEKPLKSINRIQMEDNAQLTSYLIESLNGIETVKAFNAEEKTEGETEKRFIKLLKSILKNGAINNLLSSLTGLVAGVGGIVILWVGANFVISGRMTSGQLLFFNSLLAYFVDPIKNLINLQPMMQTAVVAAERLGEILDLDVEQDRSTEEMPHTCSLKGDIEFSGIDFRYGMRQLVLKGVSLDIPKGCRIALVGESGSGKTTLVKLLMRFYKAEKGKILINGTDIENIGLESLRRRIAYVSQDTFLFSGTIRENICIGMDDPGMEKIVEAARMARAHDFIERLPLKYDTVLEENGANLSGGQRQRMAITRAVLKSPEILIMDEASSNLDSITAGAIEDMVDELGSDVTVILIAHRLSTIVRCDRIYVMDKGEIIESGTHEQLINANGKYHDMWNVQIKPDT